MIAVHVLRVFVDEHGNAGNPLGVVLDATGLTMRERQRVATVLNFSETVFVDHENEARVQLFTSRAELPFAGHALVGTAWLLGRRAGVTPRVLRPVRVADPVSAFVEEGRTWVRGALADAPDWGHVRLPDAAAVDRAAPQGDRWPKHQVWAWLDEPAGLVRARVFASAFGVVEDEACGSATMLLAARLGRPIVVRHGRGSLVRARPAGLGQAEVGGDVILEDVRHIELGRYNTE
ncbi:PhzF family phenazine biosynthesis protein [Micromonospora sagamiensis]|uniref:PhzF family phenazine biosynthesis protein n=1 Tax=Micromonospora sagamiensis TaxID=47875 RepID=A0A562WGQ5_9ACTN|nr:PhzF family phenazine biosynthesis protein [Micromonospora sagamiensis]TWJ29446.1 PhzF family phenazine biosynthesis protein [Micromonospora sagamiensis]BCL17526.1 hypothetical protein GCM10017556_52650 [Micromonospora sagamiensis]